jgi:hypothetical protein
MNYGDDNAWREPPGPLVQPLRSRFPGELALRDAREGSVRQAQICAARFAVLQLVERFSAGTIDTTAWTHELEAAAAYIDVLAEMVPAEAQRLRRVLDQLNRDFAQGAPAALLSAGDLAFVCGHLYAAWGFYHEAFTLASPRGRSAIALSAASRLAELARRLEREKLARKWTQRCRRLLARCH